MKSGSVATARSHTSYHLGWMWAALMALTLCSTVLGNSVGGPLLSVAVMLVALTKTVIVASEFMGFRRVACHWQWLMASYLVILSALLTVAFI